MFGSPSELFCFNIKRALTDLRWQLSDGVFGDLEHGELGEQRQVVRQLTDPCPSDVPLSQVSHPLQLPGEVLHTFTHQQSLSYR